MCENCAEALVSGPSTVDLVLRYFVFVVSIIGRMPGVMRRLVVGVPLWLVVSAQCRQRACIADRAAEKRSAQSNDQNRHHP